ncbi:MAG: aldehyde dehydrogenase family protein, partial [Leptospiraceae bacterium]|nr:aldehyde dehydrogenase family protein [Leptospiraceae bacterium]
MPLQSINPANGESIAEYEAHSEKEIDAMLDRSYDLFYSLYHGQPTPYPQILTAVGKAADLLESRSAEFGLLICREMGKPVSQAVAEVEKCAVLCRYYAENAETLLRPRQIATESKSSYVRYDPLGPLLAIMPWNFPFWQVFRAAVPALCAGNPVILKHASNVTGCAFKVAEVFAEAGLPEHLFQV